MISKLKKKYNWLAGTGLLLALLLAVSLVTPAMAQPPGLPHQFYGTVTINGAAAAPGTAVAAYVNGALNASTTVDSLGKYGYSPIFNVTGSGGETVTFFVGGTQAAQTATFATGGITRLDLTLNTTTLAVSTNPATSVGSSTASLNGTLSNMGSFTSVNVFFQYGLTASYGSTTPTQALTATGTFTAALTGLTPNTTYYFRAVAQSGTTTVYGTQLSLSTSTAVLAVTTSAATTVTATGATLNGDLTNLGPNTSVNVYFRYGQTGSMLSSTSTQARTATGAFTATLTGLLSSTTYYFQAVAIGSTTVYGSILTFNTGASTLGVTTGSATSIAASSAILSGTLTGLGTNSSVSVRFNYGLTTSYGSTTSSQIMTAPGAFSASISGLTASTTYHFQAVAIGSTTATGSDASFTTSASSGGTSPPHQFYGTVYVDSALAPSGTAVAAYVNGSPAASTTADSSGRYGWTTLFLVPGTSGGAVTFYVGGTLVPQTATWSSGGMSRLNLYKTGGGGGSLTITCPTSTGTSGTAYSSSIVVSGGTSPYTCSITSGGLPTGLTLASCIISGTPTANGTYSFTIQATDSAAPALTGTMPCSITIGGTPPPPGKLVGADDGSVNNWGTPSTFLVLNKYTAVATGTATSIKVTCRSNGKVKLAIYSSSGGEPNSLLGYTNAYTVSGAPTFATVPLVSSVSITSGTDYWIAFIAEQFVVGYTATGTGTRRYMADVFYSDSYAFPNPAGTGFSTDTYGHRTGAWQ